MSGKSQQYYGPAKDTAGDSFPVDVKYAVSREVHEAKVRELEATLENKDESIINLQAACNGYVSELEAYKSGNIELEKKLAEAEKKKLDPLLTGKVDDAVTYLYRMFKHWSRRSFTADDVTWCEVKGAVEQIFIKENEKLKVAVEALMTETQVSSSNNTKDRCASALRELEIDYTKKIREGNNEN